MLQPAGVFFALAGRMRAGRLPDAVNIQVLRSGPFGTEFLGGGLKIRMCP